MAPEDTGLPPEELPGQQNMFESDDSSSKAGGVRGPAHLKGTRALESLRSRVELVIKEVQRLRDENAALNKELDSLRSAAPKETAGTEIVFTESTPELKAKLEGYIATIDRLIAQQENETEDT